MSTDITTFRPVAVRGLLRGGLPEIGKIKIGEKGEWKRSRQGVDFQPPEKLDHFKVVTLERGEDGNFKIDEKLHRALGDKEPKELPVRLLYNDPALSFQHSLVAYDGRTRWCFGDGVQARRLDDKGIFQQRTCPCPNLDVSFTGNKKCKFSGRLSVVIDGAEQVGGVWTLRTGSVNTINGIQSSLDMLTAMSGGWLAGIPLLLTIRPRTAQLPGGKTSEIFVVGLEFRGSMEKLREYAERKAKADLSYGSRMKDIERRARALTAAPGSDEDPDDDGEVTQEFYPEAAIHAGPRQGDEITREQGLDHLASQQTAAVLREAQRQVEAEDPEYGRDAPEEEQKPHLVHQHQREVIRAQDAPDDLVDALDGTIADTQERIRTAAPGGQLVDLWDAFGEERGIAGPEVENFLIDQLAQVTGLEQLNQFLTANDSEISNYVADRAAQLRNKLVEQEARKAAEVPKAEHAGGRKQRAKKEPQPEPQPVKQPPVPQGDLIPEQTGEALIECTWSGGSQGSYTVAEFPGVYRRRKAYGGAGFEEEFRRDNPEVYAVHVPAELKG